MTDRVPSCSTCDGEGVTFDLVCDNCGASASLPYGMTCSNHLAKPQPCPQCASVAVYVASKSALGPMWQMWRDAWAVELPRVRVVSSWIDMSGEGEGLDWPAFIDEAKSCDLLIALHRTDDEWKGAFVEIGAALAGGAQVVVLGSPPGSWVEHPNVFRSTVVGYDPGMALIDYLARR